MCSRGRVMARGGSKRSGPSGGSAYGMPRQATTSAPTCAPITGPDVVFTSRSECRRVSVALRESGAAGAAKLVRACRTTTLCNVANKIKRDSDCLVDIAESMRSHAERKSSNRVSWWILHRSAGFCARVQHHSPLYSPCHSTVTVALPFQLLCWQMT